MRYLGGKAQIATELGRVLQHLKQDRPFLDPFCGSLAMAKGLGGPGVCCDISAPLIYMYRAISQGWDPPSKLSREEWAAAKSLPDNDPLKGFAGFGCSFRGVYFSGYAGGYVGPASNPGAQAARQVLLRDVRTLADRGVEFVHMSFFDIPPMSKYFLYLDPPYKGTAKYRGTPDIDYGQLYRHVKAWAEVTRVAVSEYAFPFGEVVWEKTRARKMVAGSGKTAIEKCFVMGPA